MKWLWLIVGGFLSGAIGSLGVGGGGVLIIFLTMFMNVSRENAAGTNLLFFIPIALFSVIIYIKQKQIDIKKALWLAACGIPGCFLGVYLSQIISTDIISKLFGICLIIISLKTLFQRKSKE
ncbi:MAG: sulfite exporter TauE/SafE family protein [Acutalibacteraceae bacterium]